jgi:maltooligosyltrehalose trehalohydrolase
MFKEDVKDGDLPHPNDAETFAMAKIPWEAFGDRVHLAALSRFRELAAFRRDIVWPLTATPCADTVSVRHEQGLIVNWMFHAGTLTLALNPTAATIDMPCVIQGTPVWTGDYHQHSEVLRLGVWSAVAWNNR